MGIVLVAMQLTKRRFIFLSIVFLVFLTWYYLFSNYLLMHIANPSLETFLTCNATFNLVICCVLVLSLLFVKTFNRLYTVVAWSLITPVGIVLIFLSQSETLRMIAYYALGGCYGLAQFASLTYFESLTVTGERGRVGGFIGFAILPIFTFMTMIARTSSFPEIALLCILLNLAVLSITLLNREELAPNLKKTKRTSFTEKRKIFFYTVPWIVFSLINATLSKSISLSLSQHMRLADYMTLVFLQGVGAAGGSMIGGVVADFFGRRPSLALALTLYGLSSALAGLGVFDLIKIIYVAHGLTWGILTVLYLLVIWGDLSATGRGSCEYALGLLVFYLSNSVGQVLTPQVLQVPVSTASLLSCLLIFLSNIPIGLAPELLPTDAREKIWFKTYIHLVKKRRRSFSNHG